VQQLQKSMQHRGDFLPAAFRTETISQIKDLTGFRETSESINPKNARENFDEIQNSGIRRRGQGDAVTA
jgi:hypothetical protein